MPEAVNGESVKLREYQQEGSLFLRSRRRCLLADEMGVGKTPQAIDASKQLITAKNILVIGKAGLLSQWQREIEIWCPSAQNIVLSSSTPEISLTALKRFVLCSYHYLHKAENLDRLRKMKWDVIICDEAQMLKNPRSLTTKAIKKLLKDRDPYLWLLSGTIATQSAMDYYVPLDLCMPDQWGGARDFMLMFCEEITEYGYKKYVGARVDKLPVLNKAMKRISLSRRLADVEGELPETLKHDVWVQVKGVRRAEVTLDELIMETPNSVFRMTYKETGEKKVAHVVDKALETDEQVIIFCHHIGVARAIEEKLGNAFLYTGETSPRERELNLEAFKRRGQYLVMTMGAGAEGLNLQHCHHIIFAELPWTPTKYEQCVGRCRRLGQQNTVIVTNILLEGSNDHDILTALEYKNSFIKEVMK